MSRFFLLGLLSLALRGEAQTFTRVYSAGAGNQLGFNNIAPVKSGGWHAAGYNFSDTLFAAFVAKYDETGQLLWSKRPAESRDPRALVTLDDGSVLFFNNNSGFQGYFDASVLHFDANGNLLGETIWGDAEDQDDWFGAKKLDNGEVIAVGMSRQGSSFSERILLVKFGADGQILWEKTYDGGLFGRFSEIILLPSGVFFTIGQYFNGGTVTGVLAKFSTDGSLLWLKAYDYGTDNAYFLTGQALSDGSLFVANYMTTQSTGIPTLVLLQIDSSGGVVGQKALKSDFGIGPVAMATLSNDTLLIAAVSNGQIFPVVDNDNVILKISPQGDLVNTLVFGTSGQDFAADAYFIGQEVVICGMTDTSADGTARRAFISKSGLDVSCCEKDDTIFEVPPPPLPAVDALSYIPGTVPVRQSRTVALSDFFLSSTTSCQAVGDAVLLPADTSICIGDTLHIGLLVNLPGDVQWSTGATTSDIRVSAPGTYAVALSGECGLAGDSITVVAIGNRVEAVVEPFEDPCPGQSISLSASGGSGFQWLDADGALLYTTANPTLEPDTATVLQLIVFDGQCRDTALVEVEVAPAPEVSAGPDATIRLGEQVLLNVSGAISYQWTPAEGLSCSDCPDPLAGPAGSTTYTVTGTDANGCSDTATVTLTVLQPCPYFIPNVFSPETADSFENAGFGIFGQEIDVAGFLMRIYSRWGELVFESVDPQVQWNGTFGDRLAPPGVYLYHVEMNTCEGFVRTSGDVTLIR
jgi:hypothetical protein